MRRHPVTLRDSGEVFDCAEGESVLAGMARLGRRGIPLGCRGGGCGVCRVQVVSGAYRARAMSRQHVTPEDEAAGIVLACCAHPLGPLTLRVLGPMRRAWEGAALP